MAVTSYKWLCSRRFISKIVVPHISDLPLLTMLHELFACTELFSSCLNPNVPDCRLVRDPGMKVWEVLRPPHQA